MPASFLSADDPDVVQMLRAQHFSVVLPALIQEHIVPMAETLSAETLCLDHGDFATILASTVRTLRATLATCTGGEGEAIDRVAEAFVTTAFARRNDLQNPAPDGPNG